MDVEPAGVVYLFRHQIKISLWAKLSKLARDKRTSLLPQQIYFVILVQLLTIKIAGTYISSTIFFKFLAAI
jgi:hypothetical protein